MSNKVRFELITKNDVFNSGQKDFDEVVVTGRPQDVTGEILTTLGNVASFQGFDSPAWELRLVGRLSGVAPRMTFGSMVVSEAPQAVLLSRKSWGLTRVAQYFNNKGYLIISTLSVGEGGVLGGPDRIPLNAEDLTAEDWYLVKNPNITVTTETTTVGPDGEQTTTVTTTEGDEDDEA